MRPSYSPTCSSSFAFAALFAGATSGAKDSFFEITVRMFFARFAYFNVLHVSSKERSCVEKRGVGVARRVRALQRGRLHPRAQR